MERSTYSPGRRFRLPNCFPLLICGLFALSTPVREQLQNRPAFASLPVEVYTGRSPHCSGRGLCKLQVREEGQPPSSDASGLLSLSTGGGLMLRLARTSMKPGLVEAQIADEQLELPASLPLTQGIRNTFPTYSMDSIPAGHYRTAITTDTLYIFFE